MLGVTVGCSLLNVVGVLLSEDWDDADCDWMGDLLKDLRVKDADCVGRSEIWREIDLFEALL